VVGLLRMAQDERQEPDEVVGNKCHIEERIVVSHHRRPLGRNIVRTTEELLRNTWEAHVALGITET
jgi:hypothetical protein